MVIIQRAGPHHSVLVRGSCGHHSEKAVNDFFLLTHIDILMTSGIWYLDDGIFLFNQFCFLIMTKRVYSVDLWTGLLPSS